MLTQYKAQEPLKAERTESKETVEIEDYGDEYDKQRLALFRLQPHYVKIRSPDLSNVKPNQCLDG